MPVSIILVCSDPATETAVREGCPAPNHVTVFSREDLVNPFHTISDHGLAIVGAARQSDAVLVDWSFQDAPAINTLCFHIRKEQLAPVIALCTGGPETRTACLATGADDAVNLPFHLAYLEAMILSYRRLVDAARASGNPSSGDGFSGTPADASARTRIAGKLRLDPSAHRFFIDNEEVELTPREFALLGFLIDRAGTLCTRDEILSAVWGLDFDTGTNMVDVYMHYVRRKLEAYGLEDMIQTVRGLGYRLEGA